MWSRDVIRGMDYSVPSGAESREGNAVCIAFAPMTRVRCRRCGRVGTVVALVRLMRIGWT